MGKGFQGAVLKSLGAKEHLLTVVGREYRAEHFVRIRLHSETLLDPDGEAPGNWIRAWFPDPDGGSKQFQRGYTLAEADPATGTLAVDFVVHHPMGPASYWATTCEPGDRIVAMRYGEEPFAPLDPPPAGYLFLGDLASYPAIHALATSVPPTSPVEVYLEKHSEHDLDLPLPDGPNVTARWVEELPDGQALAQAIAGRDWTGWYAWVTAESLSTRRARTPLQREYGLNRSTLHAQAYWIRGRAMGKSRVLEEIEERRVSEEAEKAAETVKSAEAAGAAVSDAGPEAEPASGADAAHVPPSTDPSTHAAARTDAPPTATAPGETGRPGILTPTRPVLLAAGIAQALVCVVGIVPFVLLAEVCRLFLRGAGRGQFADTAVAALVVMGTCTLATSVLLFLVHLYDSRFSASVRRRLMDRLSTLPLGWFGERRAADVKKLVADDVSALHYLVTHAVLDLVAAVVTPLATLVYLFAVQWRLALVVLVPIGVFVVVMIRISARDRHKVVVSQRHAALVAGQAQTFVTTRDQSRVLGPASVVDLPGALEQAGDFVADWQRDTGPAKIRAVMINRPTTLLGVLVAAGWTFVWAGWIGVEDLIPVLVLGPAVGSQLMGISLNIGALTAGLGARDGLELVLGTPGLAPPADRPAPPGHVRFDGVDFGYRSGRTVLHDLDLTLERGTTTAVVGPSGAGKSTLAALLARLWDPDRGSVSIDGTDLRDLTQDELYAKVTILLQDVQLIRATVRENIALTRPGATEAQIRAAAGAVHLDDVVARLPLGYDTIVDDSRLSGGERQRIGVARALLADTPIVVLDEATAAVDPDSEWAVRQGLERLLAGRTVLVVAHRLHTVRDADRIVVLENGRITESGTHDDLLARRGTYADLWAAGVQDVEEVR